jgi:tRNA threonylcarbamoyladenosine biosynthesis protein TsaB
MVILALDTTTRGGSVALWRDGDVDERAGDPARTHAERLPGDIVSILAHRGLAVADVDLYAVLVGPGSFTGMRVGIATIQGLALVHRRPVFGVSALDALAHAVVARRRLQAAQLVGAWMEAYRGEVFAALYRVDADEQTDVTLVSLPVVGAPAEVADRWRHLVSPDDSEDGAVTIVGDAVPTTERVLREAFGTKAVLLDAPLLAGVLASLAAASPERAVRPHAIVPMYVRKPDAEIARDRAIEHGAGRHQDVTPAR